MTGVVLLCAEEDDLELVSWVHNARKHGITPEVVTGVERDDEPLIEALADADARLFVILRSENLDLKRMHELKMVFAAHRRSGQELLALRLQPEEAEDAIVKIAARIGRDLRPRTGAFAAVSLSERSGVSSLSVLSERSGVTPVQVLTERSTATPRPVFNDSTPVHSGTEPTGTFDVFPVEETPTLVGPPTAPPVAEALDWARRATELEVTEPLPRVDPEPLVAAANERARASKARPFGVAALATVTAIVMLGAVVGGVLWMSASEWTSPTDGVPRSTVVAPTDGEPAVGDAPSEARIPSMPRAAEDDVPEPTTKRTRSKPRSDAREHEEAGPFETIESHPRSVDTPSEAVPSPVAEAAPAPAEPALPKAEDGQPTETASASASEGSATAAPAVAANRPPA